MSAGRLDSALALVDAEVEWTPTVWSGRPALGREGLRTWMLQFGEGMEELRVDLAEVEQHRDHVLALGVVFDSRGDQPFATRAGWTFQLDGGLIRRARAFASWPEARAAAGAP